MKTAARICCLFLVIMSDGYDLQNIGVVAPEIARSWGIDLAQFGPAFAAALAGTIPGAIFAGPISRRSSRRLVLALSLALFGAGTLASALAWNIASLAVIRFVVGLGLGASIPLVMSFAAESVASRWRATFVTIVLCGQPIGAIVGAASCARLIPVFGWQSAFLPGGLLPLLLVFGVLALPQAKEIRREEHTARLTSHREARPEARGASQHSLFNADLRASTWLLSAAAFFAVFLLYVLVNWLPGVMRQRGYSLGDSVLAINLFNVGGIVGAVLVGMLVDRLGPFKVVVPAYLLAAISIAALALSQNTPWMLLTAALISGVAAYGCGMCLGSLTVLLYPPILHASSAGFVLGTGRFGAALGPLTIGFALSLGLAAEYAFYFASIAALFAATCLLVLARIRGRASIEPALLTRAALHDS